MRGSVQYVEPLLAYVTRKYFEPSLAVLPLVAGLVANAVLLSGAGSPPIWALAYANVAALGSSAAILVAYRSNFGRRRVKIDENSISLPSVMKIDASSLESLQRSSVMWARGVEGELSMLGWRTQALAEVEIRTQHGGEEVVLVWPVRAFGRRNLDALLRFVRNGAQVANLAA